MCSYIALWPRRVTVAGMLSEFWCQSAFVSLRRVGRQARHAPRSPMCLAVEEVPLPSTTAERIWAVGSGVAGRTKKH